MTKKLSDMIKAYNEKVPVFAKRWATITPTKKSEFEKGVAEVLDVSPSEVKRGDEWEAGVRRALPVFERAVSGKGEKLAENYKIAMTTE
jgi:hypothetical protein